MKKNSSKVRIGLVGAGNVAWNLANSLRVSRYRIMQVISRSEASAMKFAQEFGVPAAAGELSAIEKDLDLVIIATSDHSIAEVAEGLAPHKGPETVFVHTSGSIPVAALAPLGERTGVFYPLQTFTKGHPAVFTEIPIFLEGNEDVIKLIRPLAKSLSMRVRELDSAGRLRLHLGAVFASNFANFMWMLAEESLAGEEGLDLSVYGPLIRECVQKAQAYGPRKAHTGPARRGDEVTMNKHLAMLAESDPRAAELYRLISAMIGERFS